MFLFLFVLKKDMISPYYVWFFNVVFVLCKNLINGGKLPSFHETNDCVCGESRSLTSRIVGGKITQPHEYPWMVALFHDGLMHCGGSLINDRYVLTAGHCLQWAKKEKLAVILGMHDRVLVETKREGGVIEEVESVIMHENFTSLQLYDIRDIALVKLKKPVVYSDKVSPVCLPKNADETYADKVALVTGWGRVGEKSRPSRFLKEAHLYVTSNANCKKNPTIGKHILDDMLCAYKHEVDACQGDSGGPIVFEGETGRFEQIGVVSWGIGCATPSTPGVYTRVNSYMPWIVSKTEDAFYCKNPD